jgi:outer membrane protein
VKYAETENFKNKQATLNNEILNINVQIAKRESLPSLNAAANNSFNFGQNVLLGTLQRNDNYANSLNLNSSFTLYNHNKIKKNTEKKQLELQGSLFDQESVKNEITVQIIQNYLQILLNKAISKIQEQSVVNSEALYKKSQITTSAGVTPKATEQEAFAELERKKQLYSQSEIDVVKAKMNLANLLQLDDYKTFEIEDIPEYILDINADALSLDEFIKTALTNNPMIKSADYKLKSTELETKILQTNYYPFISINAGLGSFYFNYFNDKYFSN